MLNEALFLQSISLGTDVAVRDHTQAVRQALGLYRRAQVSGWLFRACAALIGRPRRLSSLEGRGGPGMSGAHFAGLAAVALRQVVGSEDRAGDFDARFHPLRFEDRGRWLGLAAAWLMGVPLPPVDLIQIGEVYYVRDGHHRISVAHALGQTYIDAQVTVWG